MKTRSARLLLVAMLGIAASLPAAAQSQRPPGPEAQKAAMKRLDYMIGDWQGEGWMDMGDGRHGFRGTEKILSKLGGVALLVEGDFSGKLSGSGQEGSVHKALGVISYDSRTQKYRFNTWLATGTSGEHELVLNADGWQWEIETPNARIRYVMKLTGAGEWFEIGERSADGKGWQKFFEMTLARKP